MKITIDTREAEQMAKAISGFSDRRLQSAIAEALNVTAKAVMADWAGQITGSVDRPTALSRRSPVLMQRADVGRLSAVVALREQVTSGQAPAEYLQPLEFGGGRGLKKWERALQSRSAMPSGHKAVPGKYARLDAYGNISRGQIVQILNQLGGTLSVGYQRVVSASAARRAQAAAAKGRTYVAVPKAQGGLAAGIYERKGRALLPVVFYVPAVRYRKQLRLLQKAPTVAAKVAQRELLAAVDRRWRSLQARQARGGR